MITIAQTTWTDSTIVPGATPVRAIHWQEIRAAIQRYRLHYGLDAPTFTPPSAYHRKSNVTELREQLEYLNRGPLSWTDPTIIPGVTPVRAVHLTELRERMNEIEGTCWTCDYGDYTCACHLPYHTGCPTDGYCACDADGTGCGSDYEEMGCGEPDIGCICDEYWDCNCDSDWYYECPEDYGCRCETDRCAKCHTQRNLV